MKYIVYLTINKINYKKYIGVHKTADPNVFDGYLGCGIRRNVPSTYKKSSTPFQYAVNKYGVDNFKRLTLAVFDNEEDAYTLEEHLVNDEWVKRTDTYNATQGGGCVDYSIKCYQYDFNGNFIREYESYSQAGELNNCSGKAICTAVTWKRSSVNSLWTNIYVKHLDISEFCIDQANRIIYEYDADGNFIKSYESVNEIIDTFGVTRSSINRAIQGKYSMLGKYYSLELVDKFQKIDNKSLKNSKIYIYTANGEFFKEFGSPLKCAQFFGDKSSSAISSTIRLGRLYKGYQISTEKLPYMKCYDKENVIKKKPVDQFDLNGNYIKTRPSTTDAIKVYGTGVKKVALGQQSKCHNFIFRYKKS